MEKHATLDKVIQDLHDKTYKTYVNFPILDHECHQEHLLELAEHIRHWRTIVPRLGFGPNVVEDLDHTRQNEQGKRQEMLSFWKCANGSRATYRNLATAFLKDKQRNLAEKVVKLSNKPPNEGKYVSCSLFCTVLNLHPFSPPTPTSRRSLKSHSPRTQQKLTAAAGQLHLPHSPHGVHGRHEESQSSDARVQL